MNPCVIIPAFNCEHTIGPVVSCARRYLPGVLVINDGSTDQTPVAAENAGAMVINHQTNKGKGAALKTAFEYTNGSPWDTFVILDADGQHNPHEITNFLETYMEDHEAIIIGNRMHNPKDMPKKRLMTNKLMSWIISFLVKQKIPDTQCGYKLIPKSVLRQMKFSTETNGYDFDSELLLLAARQNIRIRSINVECIYGHEQSRIQPLHDTLRFISLVRKFMKKDREREKPDMELEPEDYFDEHSQQHT